MTHPQTQDDEALGVQWWPGARYSAGTWHVVTSNGRHISAHDTEGAALTALRNHEGRK